ncbi:MAG: Gfo/Idh/MocA family oxidoreductase [Spirochaetes bacterium]|nr:Gfo/Idh/MocA family oxidoreductase [Spirochaetota bacterium]
MKNIKTALIGCGRIGFLLENDPLRFKPCTHYGGAKAAGIKINCACDINKDRLNKFAETAGLHQKNLYTDYRELIVKEHPWLVIIATWTNSHAEIGIFAAKNGATAIICEKPIASNLKDAGEFLSQCRKHKVNLIVNHERRYDARYRAVKKMLTNNRIGEVKTVYASVLSAGSGSISTDIAQGGGPLLHDGTHMIDIIRYFFGDISSVRGEIQKKMRAGFEKRAVAWLKTKSGVDIFLEAGGARNYFVFEIQISGTEGKIVIGNGYQNLYLNTKSKYYTGFRDLSEKPFPDIKGINYFKKEYLEAKKLLKNNQTDIASSGYDGYKALEAVHAIYLSSYLAGKQIELPVMPNKVNLHKIFGI